MVNSLPEIKPNFKKSVHENFLKINISVISCLHKLFKKKTALQRESEREREREGMNVCVCVYVCVCVT